MLLLLLFKMGQKSMCTVLKPFIASCLFEEEKKLAIGNTGVGDEV